MAKLNRSIVQYVWSTMGTGKFIRVLNMLSDGNEQEVGVTG